MRSASFNRMLLSSSVHSSGEATVLFLDNFYLPADQICKAPLRGVMSPTSPIAAGHARCSSGKPRRRPFDEGSIFVIRHGSHQSSPEATVRLHNSPNDKANGNHQLGIKTNHSLT